MDIKVLSDRFDGMVEIAPNYTEIRRAGFDESDKLVVASIVGGCAAAIQRLIDEEIERQEPCDACNNGDHGTTFKVDIEFGKRLSLTMRYCPTCGRKMRP